MIYSLLAMLLVAPAQQECLGYDTVVQLEGTVAQGAAMGQDGRELSERPMILMLKKPVCVATAKKKIREVQIEFTSERDRKQSPRLLQADIVVRGKLREAKSHRHQTAVWIEVEAWFKAR